MQKIPGATLKKINQKVGLCLVIKFGSKGLISIGKMVSVVGAVVRGGFDLVETKLIVERAYKWFFDGEFEEETKEEVVYEVSEDNNSVKVFNNVLKNIKDIKVKNPFKKDK